MSEQHRSVPRGARRARLKWFRSTARGRVWAYAVAAVIVIVAIATLSVRPLVSGRSEVQQVTRDDVALREVLDLRATLADWQLFLEQNIAKLSTTAIVVDPVQIANAALLAQTEATQASSAAKTLQSMGYASNAHELTIASTTFTASLNALGPLVAGRPPAVIASVVGSERAAFTHARAVAATAATQLRQASAADAQQGIVHLDNGRATVLIADAVAALLAIGAAWVLGQRLHRRELASGVNAKRRRYEATLQEALDMAKTEPDAYGIMTRALRESVPHLQVEMLVADSSRAHMRRTLTTSDETDVDQRTGCGVSSPVDCPATQRGHTLLFPSSQALNACPHLTGRASGNLSAACVAISITGQSSGVVHATGPDGMPPSDSDVSYLEITSRRASERIAMLRAFEKSEVQARTDPLTGLWNRRSLENRINDLQREGTPYALAYGDLDHFKLVNDTHGHEAGDQALRMFSRVLRDAIRPTDVSARYGGEEFVIVFPDCAVETAGKVLERIREQLALTLSTGRVPAFTVSFGLASSTDADTFDEVVAVADQALLAAKAAGRNRTVLAASRLEQLNHRSGS